jgi:hypothetical protein
MSELYWITRLDAICAFLWIVSLLSFLLLGISLFVGIISKINAEIDEEDCEDWNKYMQRYKECMRYAKIGVIVFFVSIFMNIFIPTTNQALLIYGVGGTIDYIKSNGTAKQLPDKCVKALDKYLDNLTKEENQKGSKENDLE